MRQKLSPEDNRRAWRWAALIVLMMLALGAGVLWLLQATRAQDVHLPPESDALRQAAQGLDDVRIRAELDPDNRLLTFTQEMRLTNRTGTHQDAILLRSWTGAYLSEETSPAASDELFYDCYGASFDPGGLTVVSAKVDGADVRWAWLDDASTVLSLPADWPADAAAEVTLQCSVVIPRCASRFGYADDVFMLGNVFPVAAIWQDGAWRMDPYCAIGDPFLSECANWDVTLTVPADCTAAASVRAEPTERNGQRVYAFTGSALRDFALVVSDRFVSAEGMAGDTLVTAFARTRSDAQQMLQFAKRALDSYERRWGDYAYPTFTLTESIFPYGGMEYPGLVMIASDVLHMGGQVLELTIAHETAHQWWAMMVGSDSWYQPWQDESLCEYAWLDYVGDWYGADARERMAFDRIETSLRITIPRGVTPGSPIDYFADLTEYSRVVYQRGAALWRALEMYMGKGALDALLRDYQAQYRFRNATRDDLTTLISAHAGKDMSGLMLDYLDTMME